MTKRSHPYRILALYFQVIKIIAYRYTHTRTCHWIGYVFCVDHEWNNTLVLWHETSRHLTCIWTAKSSCPTSKSGFFPFKCCHVLNNFLYVGVIERYTCHLWLASHFYVCLIIIVEILLFKELTVYYILSMLALLFIGILD